MSGDRLDERLRERLLEQSHEAIVLLDVQGRIVGWYAGAEDIFGYRSDEILGEPLARLFIPEERALGVPEHELAVARENGTCEDDRWQLRKDGSRVWISGSVSSLLDENGQLIGFGKIMRNRTDLKGKVTALQVRLEKLQKQEERRGAFFSILAHELANAFVALKMALPSIRRKVPKDESELEQYLSIVEDELEVTQRLIEDLKDMARLGTNRLNLQRSRVNLNQLLSEVVESCRPEAEEREQNLRLLLPDYSMVVDGDGTRLRQVFRNLLGNASKFTPANGQIWVRVASEADEVVVKVGDTGVGVAPDVLPTIFELFTQEQTESQVQVGMGVGLWLVQNLVRLHGGTVTVLSDGKGKGSEFTVRLPLKEITQTEGS